MGLKAYSRKKQTLEKNYIKGEGDAGKTEKVEDGNASKSSDEPASKKRCASDLDLPTFRATCYRSSAPGSNIKHIFQSPQAAAAFGGSINDHFGWQVDLKNFDVEVVLTVEDKHVYVALALTRESLHKRNIAHFGPTTLRPTIAYNMLQ